MAPSSDRDWTPAPSRTKRALTATRLSILDALLDHPGPRSLNDLAAELVANERDRGATPETPDPGHQEEVRLRLHHVDLPMLAAGGYLEYDPDTHLVSLADTRDD